MGSRRAERDQGVAVGAREASAEGRRFVAQTPSHEPAPQDMSQERVPAVRVQHVRRDRTAAKLVVFGVLATLIVLVAAAAPLLVPYDPNAQDLAHALEAPSATHLAGTDRYGRDLLTRVIMGAQPSVFFTLALVALVAGTGTLVGMLCGWRSGRLDTLLMRVSDLFLAFPGLVFALAIAGVLGGGMANAVLSLALIGWPKYARIARGLILVQRGEPYLDAARLAGCSTAQLLCRHLLPNIAGPILVTAALDIGTMMMELAGLSFLGLGAQPPVAEWGSMMSDARNLLQTAPWMLVAPGCAIFLTVMVFNLLGDTLRDALDPARSPLRTASAADDPASEPKEGLSPALSATSGAPLAWRAEWTRRGCAVLACVLASALLLDVIGRSETPATPSGPVEASGVTAGSMPAEKVFVYGTTGYGVQMDDVGLNPHSAYSGWSAVRYGVAETLFRFSDAMDTEPWLATGYERLDDTHVRIDLREDVTFSNGRPVDAEAVKECLDDLMATHDRAPSDLKIAHVAADGMSVTVETTEPCPALINYLCDPYASIIDMRAGVTADGNVVGTGPYTAETVTDTEIVLHPNERYWGGAPKVSTVVVRAFTDTDALQSALQAGEVNAAYGLAYASYPLFANDRYHVSDCFTSRVFFAQANFASPLMADEAVRTALAMGIDKEGFVSTLLNGRGEVAEGPFPASMRFGDDTVTTERYDLEGARRLLDEAGWRDIDGDGVREKEGRTLTLRWLTYPGRPELPLLAESAQATLKEIGFDVQVLASANHTELRKDASAWDVYASALVTAPTGDPEYFFGATCLGDAPKNFGGYRSVELDALYGQLRQTFDAGERGRLATKMSQRILDDHGYLFASFLQMGIVSEAHVSGMGAHACDYYEITSNLDV